MVRTSHDTASELTLTVNNPSRRPVFPSGRGSIDEPSFYELSVMLKARVRVLFGAEKFGNGHICPHDTGSHHTGEQETG